MRDIRVMPRAGWGKLRPSSVLSKVGPTSDICTVAYRVKWASDTRMGAQSCAAQSGSTGGTSWILEMATRSCHGETYERFDSRVA